MPLVEQELLTLSDHTNSPRFLVGFVLLDLLVLCVCFVDRCSSMCAFSFGNCVVCSSIYRFWLPPFGIFKLFFFFGYGKPSTYWCLLSGACLVKCFQILYKKKSEHSKLVWYNCCYYFFLVIYYQFLQFFF